jgi:hypothetical protein
MTMSHPTQSFYVHRFFHPGFTIAALSATLRTRFTVMYSMPMVTLSAPSAYFTRSDSRVTAAIAAIEAINTRLLVAVKPFNVLVS